MDPVADSHDVEEDWTEVDDVLCFAKLSFDVDASTEVKEEFVSTFAKEKENRELLLKL